MIRAGAFAALGIALAVVACGTSTTSEQGAAKDTPPGAKVDKPEPPPIAAATREPPPASPAAEPPAPPPPPPPPPPREHGISGLLEAVPRLIWRRADVVEDQWYQVKGITDLVEQAAAVRELKLHQTACKGLVDVRRVDPARAPFGYRDHVRGRSWARPVVARILAHGLELLQEQLPDRIITIGDVSQPGCGQLEHGAIVRLLSDGDPARVVRPGAPPYLEAAGAATTLLNQARLVHGVPTVVELIQGRDMRGEGYRTSFPEEPVMVRHQILAQGTTSDGKLLLKTVSRRYRALLEPGDEEVEAFVKGTQRLMRAGAVVHERRTTTWDPATGENVRVWVQRWASSRMRQQLEIVATRKLHRKLDLSALVQVRRARWHGRKPGSFRSETMWMTHSDDGRRRWHRWKKLYEAGHITHLAGRDADLSYVTTNNASHFRVDMEAIDVEATWTWFTAMAQAAKAAGVAIDRIIVDRKVKRLFKQRLSKKLRRTPLWRRIRVVSGHDGHHHVRFTRATKPLELKAVGYLERSFGLTIPSFGL